MEIHYATLWESLADAIGDREALVCGKSRRTWGEFDDRAARLAVFENPETELPDGALVNVLLSQSAPEPRLAIPAQAVQRDLAGAFAMVVAEGDVVEQRRIDVGETTQGLTAIASGLEEGERVITDGINKVRPGIQVDAALAGDG